MAYQALYRKWRPRTFDAVVGQEAITDTLKNSIKRGKVSHAFLFAGPRGTGKTSCAKIFAKALNCLNLQDGEPCNECANCLAADQGAMPDITEMDAASNNSVDEIRELLDKVHYAPTEGKYKVYIIDEVHMLSISAFNALLKTLEEPPASVIFILATTELQKVPATIISRTQRYNFKRISNADLIKRMEYILGQEGVAYEDRALSVIAQVADGGMRDALSILDQLLSFEKDKLLYDDALEITGFAAREDIEQLLLALLNRDAAKALDLAKKAIANGASSQNILNEIISLAVQIMLLAKSGQGQDAFVSEGFADAVSQVPASRLTGIVEAANQALGDLRFTNQQQIPLEVFLVKAAQESTNNASISGSAPAPAANPAMERQLGQLKQQIHNLTQEVAALKANPGTGSGTANLNPRHVFQMNQRLFSQDGAPTAMAQQAAQAEKAAVEKFSEIASSKDEIYAVLSEATKAGLNEAKNLWERDLPSMLEGPAKSALTYLEPIAASDNKLLLASKSRAWQIAVDPKQFMTDLDRDLEQLTKESWTIAVVEEKAWPKIRQDFIKEHAKQLQERVKRAKEAQKLEQQAPAQPQTTISDNDADYGPVPPDPEQGPVEASPLPANNDQDNDQTSNQTSNNDNRDVIEKAQELFGDVVKIKD